MKRKILSLIFAVVLFGTLVGCDKKKKDDKNDYTKVCNAQGVVKQVVNGGFETGDLTGWTAIGEAFDDLSVTIQETFWAEKIPFGHTGKFHLFGISDGKYEDGTEVFKSELLTGKLKSSNFTLCGDGLISFKLGAARNNDTLYVEVRLVEGDKLIAKQSNTEFADFSGVVDPQQAIDGIAFVNNYATFELDLSDVDGIDYRGQEMYVVLVDEAAHGDFGFINFDDLRTYYVDGVAEPQTEGSIDDFNYLERTCSGVTPNSQYEISNPGFEEGNLCGWEIVEGKAFHDAGVNDEPTWWAENITYNRDGDYHYGMYSEGETGILRSRTFTLGGVGQMTFKLGGNGGYISIIKADGTEIARFINTEFADINFPNVDEGMRLANMVQYKVDLTQYAELGDELYIEITDNKTSGWGLMTFDSFFTHYETVVEDGVEAVNQLPIIEATAAVVKAETSQSQADLDAAEVLVQALPEGETKTLLLSRLQIVYEAINGGVKNEIVNSGFETGSLSGWTIVEGDAFNDEGITSDATWWAEAITYNRDGNYHFGMYNEGGTGILRSSKFVLGGVGHMTFKLGGNGGYISIYKADGSELARFENSAFADINFPNVDQGMRLANMELFRVDLTQYAELGDELYIEIVDNKTSGWGLMTFDSFNTFYEVEVTEGVEAINILDVE